MLCFKENGSFNAFPQTDKQNNSLKSDDYAREWQAIF